jgi:hypothetical protein
MVVTGECPRGSGASAIHSLLGVTGFPVTSWARLCRASSPASSDPLSVGGRLLGAGDLLAVLAAARFGVA